MSDDTREHSREQQNFGPTESTLAAHRMMEEVNSLRSFSGQICRNQPREGEVPMLRYGVPSNGCSVGDANGGPGRRSESVLEFNTGDLYRQAQQENVRFAIRTRDGGFAGSGVTVGRNGDTCLVATSLHVVEAERGNPVTSRGARMADGQTYPASIAVRDRRNDLALVTVNTGANTENACLPARVVQSVPPNGPVWATGFPEGTRTLTVSPGDLRGRQLVQADPRPGSRPMNSHFVLAHTREGNSGGPVYNRNGEVFGLVQSGPSIRDFPRESIRHTNVTPLTQGRLDQLINVFRRNLR